jgi:transposase
LKHSTASNHHRLRYPSDLTDGECEQIEPLIPRGKRGGGKRTVVMREVVNGLMYILSTGCEWRAIPKDLPPKSTIYDYFDLSTYDGTFGGDPPRPFPPRRLCEVSRAGPKRGQPHRRHHR